MLMPVPCGLVLYLQPMNRTEAQRLPVLRIFQIWWPLAASWIMMSLEGPAVSAIIARLVEPEINLASYGVVFSLALIIESPIIMLLAASTALSKDWESFARMRNYMRVAATGLTALHLLVAFTPIYYMVVRDLIGAPAEILEPARIGFQIMTPWTASIAYRRFNQGVLIRFGRSQAVGKGTIVRLSANILVLAIGYLLKDVPGIVVGTSAVAVGVMSEAAFAGIAVQPVLRGKLRQAPPSSKPVTLPGFLNFYIPLAMTSLLFLIAQPIGTAAASRLPMALESLAVWPVVSGLVFLFRSLGVAYNEVVVALLDEPLSMYNLRRFTGWLAGLVSLAMLLVTATPMARIWLEVISALSPELVELGRVGLLLALPLPAMAVLQSWYQGAILHGKQTRGISEATVIYLASNAALLFASVALLRVVGLYVLLIAMGISMALQTAWLWWRSRDVLRALDDRDASYARHALMEESGADPQIRATNTPG